MMVVTTLSEREREKQSTCVLLGTNCGACRPCGQVKNAGAASGPPRPLTRPKNPFEYLLAQKVISDGETHVWVTLISFATLSLFVMILPH